MGRKRNELRNVADLILELRIIVAVWFEDQFLYSNFSAPPHFWIVPPHFICFGDGTAYITSCWEPFPCHWPGQHSFFQKKDTTAHYSMCNVDYGQNPKKQNPEIDKIPKYEIPNWTKPRTDKILRWKIPERTKSQMDKIPNGQNSELDKIPNV